MFGVHYLKAPPTTFVMHFRRGKLIKEGAGLSFFYFAPTSTVVEISQSTIDVPFVFEEMSADFQEITIQGALNYRVADPGSLSAALDYSVDVRGRHVSDDPENLNERLIQAAQVRAHAFAQQHGMQQLLTAAASLSVELEAALRESSVTTRLGIELLSLHVLSIKAAPEMAKAMQAEAREQLLLKADQAVFARRNSAIELEREIKENELNTERAIEEKRREVRQAQMQADVAIEEQRAELVQRQVANERELAKARSEALRETLDAMKSVDWRTLAAAQGPTGAKELIAMAFQQLAENAEKIGRLDISPDLLSKLLQDDASEG